MHNKGEDLAQGLPLFISPFPYPKHTQTPIFFPGRFSYLCRDKLPYEVVIHYGGPHFIPRYNHPPKDRISGRNLLSSTEINSKPYG